MSYKERYEQWLNDEFFDETTRKELEAITDDKEIEDRLGIVGFVFTIVMDMIVALKTQTYCGNYYGNFNVNILFESIAVFTAFKYGKEDTVVLCHLAAYSEKTLKERECDP